MSVFSAQINIGNKVLFSLWFELYSETDSVGILCAPIELAAFAYNSFGI